MELLDTADHPLPTDPDGTVRVLCPPQGWPRARIRVTNRSSRRLFVSVLVLSELYGVSTLLEGEGEWLDPGTAVDVPAWDGTPDVYFYLPGGAPMTTDVLMVIAATEEFSSASLRQDDLVPPARSAPTRSPHGARKGISATPPPQPPERLEDWTTTQLRVRTYRPGDLQRLSACDRRRWTATSPCCRTRRSRHRRAWSPAPRPSGQPRTAAALGPCGRPRQPSLLLLAHAIRGRRCGRARAARHTAPGDGDGRRTAVLRVPQNLGPGRWCCQSCSTGRITCPSVSASGTVT